MATFYLRATLARTQFLITLPTSMCSRVIVDFCSSAKKLIRLCAKLEVGNVSCFAVAALFSVLANSE